MHRPDLTQFRDTKNKPLYFTLQKAQRLTATNITPMTDIQLQKHIVRLRDFERYLSFPDVYGEILVNGGYYSRLIDGGGATGVVPKDPWLLPNISYCLGEAINEKSHRLQPACKEGV